MPLKSVKIRPGFNKTDTASGAEGQWVDGDFVRFRYGQPQKIGGWKAIGQQTVAGPAIVCCPIAFQPPIFCGCP